MASSEFKRNAAIIGSGSYVPEQIVPNTYFNALLGEDVDTWLRENVQIYERRWCSKDQSTADLIEQACVSALESANIGAEDIDLLIVATDTPEFVSPSTASVIQDRLQMKNAGTFDVNTACAGFVTALDIGAKFIQADQNYNLVMVVGAYAMSKYLNLQDKKTVTLFADGAAAVVLRATVEDKGLMQSKLLTKGEYNSWMGIYGGATHMPLSAVVLENKEHLLKFVKKIPTHINPEIWSEMIKNLCAKSNILPSDIDHFFLTQININSIFATMDILGVDREKAATIMHKFGYTGSAAIPMAFDIWNKENRIKSGDIVCFVGSGGGLAFGAALFKM
ncbi:MAG: ketoacyl-ACP synthase III [Saprospiraceae bacterium]|nr:ketoacyl-ACP synthase III [Saprospiraceae bacterium]MBP8212162.1 ketoacyl-ACP synthase III [Saprospiraceae bacterium]